MRRFTTALSVLACAGGLLVAAPAAQAATSPHVSLQPDHTNISATHSSGYHYRARHMHKHTRVVLQVFESKHWVTLAKSKAHTGSFNGHFRIDGPGEPGRFSLRAALLHDGHVGHASGTHHVYAFAKVSMQTLCQQLFEGYCVNGSEKDEHGSTLHYNMATGIDEPSDGFDSQFGAKKTSCRSLTMRYLSDSPDDTNTYVTVRQTGAKDKEHTSSSRYISTFTVKLTGHKFGVNVAQDSSQVFMFFGGSGYCYTADGKV